jgi:hypothetical protein
MRTADQLLADFGLETVEAIPRATIAKRLRVLAEYTEAYEASFEKLSTILQRRTQKLRAAEDREAELAGQLERALVAAAERQAVVEAIWRWDAQLGTAGEGRAMADLREALAMYRFSQRHGS